MFNKAQRGISMSQTILRLAQVKQRTGISRSSIYNAIKQGTFPRQINLGPRAVGWVEKTIDSWIAQRIALSSKAEG